MIKRSKVLVAMAMIAGSTFAGLARADDYSVMGPGGGDDGGKPGVGTCFSVFKESLNHTDRLVPVGDYILYKIHVKALCDLPKAHLIDNFPGGTTLFVSSPGAPTCTATATPAGDRLDCRADNVKAGAEADVFALIKVAGPADRTIWNKACFTDDILGGFACHAIHHFVTPQVSCPQRPAVPAGSFFSRSDFSDLAD